MKNKRVLSIFMLFVFVSLIFNGISYATESTITNNTVQMSKGSVTVDGKVDTTWNKTNYIFIDKELNNGEQHYTGWVKVLWSNLGMYVLGNIHTLSLDNSSASINLHDCIEIYIDENYDRSSANTSDDYYICCDFNGQIMTDNYQADKVKVKTNTFDTGFVVEMYIPWKNYLRLSESNIGFDIRVHQTGDFGNDSRDYSWNYTGSDIKVRPDRYGTLNFVETATVLDIDIPQYKRPVNKDFYVQSLPKNTDNILVQDVSVRFDSGSEELLSVLHVNEYPCLEINELANVIGATVTDGNTISKDGITVTYTAGERIAQDNGGNFIMQCEAVNYEDKLYVPISSLDVTFIYNTEYNRFEKILDIIPKHAPKEAEMVVKVKDYGAVGDGVHDDKNAILAAFYAASTAGVPVRLEFESGKKYFISEVMDTMYLFQLLGVEDFVFAGNGATLLFDAPMNNLITIGKCARIRIENLTIDTVTPVMTQGKVVGVNLADRSIEITIDEGYSAMPDSEWINAVGTEYAFAQIIDAVEDHPKYISKNHLYFKNITNIGNNTYKMNLKTSYVELLPEIEINDRIVIARDVKNYDISHESKQKWSDSSISILNSGDIEIADVSMYGNIHLASSGNYNWGNITFDNFNVLNHEGEIYSSTRDIIHFTHSRGGMLIQNCTFNGAGDDYINTKTSPTEFKSKISDRTYQFDAPVGSRIGDEVLVFDVENKQVLGRAFIESIQWDSSDLSLNKETMIATLDREIEGIKVLDEISNGKSATVLYNIDVATGGTVVRNNVFTSGRRHAWINRSPNSIFENNYTKNMGGSMIDGSNEIGGNNEGPFPSAFTIRNNEYYCSGNSFAATYPLRIRSYNAKNGQTATIDGVLVEGNYFEIPRTEGIIKIADTTDLYMINNTLKSTVETTKDTLPVQISNSKVKLIDGLTADYTNDVKAIVNLGWTEYDSTTIKNIELTGSGNALPLLDYSGMDSRTTHHVNSASFSNGKGETIANVCVGDELNIKITGRFEGRLTTCKEKIIVATYNANSLVGIKLSDVDFTVSNSEKSYESVIDIFETVPENIDKIKVFLWDDFNYFVPIMESKEINVLPETDIARYEFNYESDIASYNGRITSHNLAEGILSVGYSGITKDKPATITLESRDLTGVSKITVKAKLEEGTKLRVYDSKNSANHGVITVSDEQAGQWVKYTFPTSDAKSPEINSDATIRLDILGGSSSEQSGTAYFDSVVLK